MKVNGVDTRVYLPTTKTSKERPLLIYIHGGGYLFGVPEVYDESIIELVRRLDIAAVSIE